MRIVFALLFGMMLAGSPSAVLADTDAVAGAAAALEQGAYGAPLSVLIEARGELERLSAAEPKNALLHYYVALADWRLVSRIEDKKRSKQYCMEGLERLDQALTLDPEMADALSLKVGLQGMSIQFDPASGMTVGPEMEANTQRAIELEPDNPRVHFLDALNTLHKPSFIGGGAKNAMPKFEKAQALFESIETDDKAAPRWGHEDTCLWAGRTAMKLENYDAAQHFFNQALEINPKNEWVRNVLLPEAEAKIKEKDKS